MKFLQRCEKLCVISPPSPYITWRIKHLRGRKQIAHSKQSSSGLWGLILPFPQPHFADYKVNFASFCQEVSLRTIGQFRNQLHVPVENEPICWHYVVWWGNKSKSAQAIFTPLLRFDILIMNRAQNRWNVYYILHFFHLNVLWQSFHWQTKPLE